MFHFVTDDRLKHHNGSKFSSKDRDNDSRGSYHCASVHQGPWWYHSGCYHANLNISFGKMYWYGTILRTVMMIMFDDDDETRRRRRYLLRKTYFAL